MLSERVFGDESLLFNCQNNGQEYTSYCQDEAYRNTPGFFDLISIHWICYCLCNYYRQEV